MNKLIALAITVSILLFSSYLVRATDSINISGIDLSLANCVLIYKESNIKKKKTLSFPDNCKLHINKLGMPRVEFVHGKYVIIVERSIPHPKQNIDSFYEGKCDTQLLGVVINNNNLDISKNVVKIMSCSGLMWDKKVFSSFAKSNTM